MVYDLELLNELLLEKYLDKNSVYYEYISYLAHITTLHQSKQYKSCQFFIIKAFEFILKAEIKNDFQKYVNKSKKYMKRIAYYMDECGFIDNEILERFKGLEIIKRQPGKKDF